MPHASKANLNLVLQIMEITDNIVVCVNLMDEAGRKRISIDLKKLSRILGVPVIGTSARKNEGLQGIKGCCTLCCKWRTKGQTCEGFV